MNFRLKGTKSNVNRKYYKFGKEKYLEYAQKAAAYFLSWMFAYDAFYSEDCDFKRLGYHTAGGTVVSAEHQCIDPYACVIVPDLFELSELDKNPLWENSGKLIWNNILQCIADLTARFYTECLDFQECKMNALLKQGGQNTVPHPI